MTFSMRRGLVLALLSTLGISSSGQDESGLFVESDICGPDFVGCAEASFCFDHTTGACLEDGNTTLVDCEEAYAFCQQCYPNSRCGSTELPPVDESAMFVESDICGPEFAACAEAGVCFDETLGTCLEDGSVSAECQEALACASCFPNSRCGSTEGLMSVSESGTFVESEICPPEFAACAEASLCFDETLGGCLEDGSLVPDCQEALACATCFPNSKCGTTEVLPLDESAEFVESEACGPILADCAQGASCFDHTTVCQEDGTVTLADCELALQFCAPCFPKSRCGTLEEAEATEAPVEETEAPVAAPVEAPVEEDEAMAPDEMEGCDEDSAPGIRPHAMALSGILALVVGLSWY